MAATGDAQKDMPAHQATYAGFLTLLKVGTVASFAIGLLVVFAIAN